MENMPAPTATPPTTKPALMGVLDLIKASWEMYQQKIWQLVAVQFVEDVYLTDGWMVPDRILFCQQGADNIRPSTRRRTPRARRLRSRRR